MGKFFKTAVSRHVVRKALETLKKKKIVLQRNWIATSGFGTLPPSSITNPKKMKGMIIISKKAPGKTIGYKEEVKGLFRGGKTPKRSDLLMHELGHALAVLKGTRRQRRRYERFSATNKRVGSTSNISMKGHTKDMRAAEQDAHREAIKFIKKHSKKPKKDLKSYKRLQDANNVNYKDHIADLKKEHRKDKKIKETFAKHRSAQLEHHPRQSRSRLTQFLKKAQDLTPKEKQKLFNQAIISRFSVDAAKDEFARPHLKRYQKVKDLPLIGDTINKGIEWFIKRSKKKYPKTNQAISDLVTESPHTKKLTNKDLRKVVEDIADHTTKYKFDVKKLQSINEADSTAAANAGVSPLTVYKSWK